ncbi:MAG: ABC transporter ATP-binding protein [Sedimentisphaerales bacterium]|nr:ABC transporter ATP-binding protein [Sedimentisphaerales bacterium]
MQYAIETFSLTKIFSDWWGRDKVVAVDDLNLKIRTNEVFGLLGPNGSGKTTTLKLLLGLLHPTKGRSLLLEGSAADPQISTRIGFLPEESYLYKYLTARETLEFYGRLFKLPAKVRKLRTEALLDMVGLKAVANRHVGTFSKGMARRIGLAQALINDPDLLILDEPTTGLDPIGTRQIKDLIIELAKRGKTILLCNHLLADVEDVCDRIAILYGGKIQAEGNVSDLLRRTDKTEITTGLLSPDAVKKIERIFAEERAEYSISAPMTKLETFFIDIIAAAQQQELPTSGAESKRHISEFLSAKPQELADRQAILDQLVSSGVQQDEPADTVTRQPQPRPSPSADEDFLKGLVQTDASAGSQTAVPKPVEPTPVLPPQPDRNVIDELLGKPASDGDVKENGDTHNA